ncbi:FtsK/SpoIIIE domain-containing protein [Phytohabitans flavus]|nr:FtsK/SpoIIIE domain-containing protein [Phytohabitans flavus]
MTVVDLSYARRADVLVEAAAEATVDSVARELGRLVRGGSGPDGVPPVMYVDGRPVDPRLPVAAAPLREGTVVSLDDPAGCPPPEPAGTVELRVTGGPQSGTVYRLGPGDVVVGAGPAAGIRVTDPYLAGAAFTLAVDPAGQCTVTIAADGAARLDGQSVTDQTPWPFGAQLAVGASLFEVAVPTRPDAVLHVSADGVGLDYNRPPRVRPRRPQTRFRLPLRPKQNESGAMPIVMALSPLVLAVGTAAVLRTWAYLLIGILSPIAMLVHYAIERRQGRKSFGRQVREYEALRERIESDARQALAAERALRRRDHPDPAQVLLTAVGPRAALWERRRFDPDFLTVRLGTGEVDSGVRLEDPEAVEHQRETVRRLGDSPVVVPLRDVGVLGVAGAGDLPRSAGRWIVGQLAALHSPRDMQIWLLTDPAGQPSWEWVRWLPHARATGGDQEAVLIGTDDESTYRRVTELTTVLAARQRAARASGSPAGAPPGQADLVVVLDGARRLRGLPGMVQILAEGPAVGIYAVCLEEDERRLPAECQAVAVEEGAALRVEQARVDPMEQVRPDLVPSGWGERVARALAPVRDISDQDEEARLPDSVRLLDVLGLEPPDAAAVAARWSAGGRSTRAVVGIGLDGLFPLDISGDSRHGDGPHGLVAGTTGSGKSELLQTLIAALAVANRPDEMTFVLVDYKGGSAFKDCAKLPHTVGMVTDLDGHLTARALESLAAELRRRERLVFEADTNGIEGYLALRDSGRALEPMPRLVIVIDEFASLVAELPDFVAGLVDIARRGRSLGVHLLLATQRPAGVVTADIRANTNLRIALRVTDAADSSDVIDVPDAARISRATPGRLYLRSGTKPLQVVQSARIGGYRPRSRTGAPPPVRVAVVPWQRLGSGLTPAPASADDEQSLVTDLAVLVEAIGEAARSAGIPPQASPWLPPLPDTVTLEELRPEQRYEGEVAPIPFGLTDLPAAQARTVLALDLVRGGHLVVAGSPQTGRSTVLRTIAGSVAAHAAPIDVHLYGIDCGANALLPLVALPHCGAVVGRDQVERMERLLGRLHAEVARRQQALAAAGFSGLAEQRAAVPPEQRLPWMLLLLDRWEGFLGAYESYDYGRLVESAIQLLREGPAVGLRAVVTGDRSALVGQISTIFEQRLVLQMAEPSDYGYAGINERHVPAHMPPGRAVELAGVAGALRESQIALLDPDPAGAELTALAGVPDGQLPPASGAAQVAALHRLAREATERHGTLPRPLRPLHVDPLPVRVTTGQAHAADPGFAPPSPLWALVGVGGDELGPVGLDLLAEGPAAVVAGPPRSGRSTAVLTMVDSLRARQVPVVVVTPRRSPLRDLAGAPGVLGVLEADADRDALRAAIGGQRSYVVVVDDAELLRDTPLDDELADVLREARDGEHGMIVAGLTDDLKNAYRGFAADALRSRSGLLLAVQSADDGDILGVRLPRNAGTGGPIGRATLVRLSVPMPVQVALPD